MPPTTARPAKTLWLSCSLLVACNAVFGLDDRPERATPTASSTSSSGGGVGGMGGAAGASAGGGGSAGNSPSDTLWAYRFGGFLEDHARSLAVNANGDVLVGGIFAGSLVFDVTMQATGEDGFALKLSADGDAAWSVQLGDASGSAHQTLEAVAFGADGTPYLAGNYSGNAELQGTSLPNAGVSDILLARLDDATGNVLQAHTWGGADTDGARSLAPMGTKLVLVGHFNGTLEFPPAATLVSQLGFDVYTTVLNPDGTPEQAVRMDLSTSTVARAVAAGANGYAVVGYYGLVQDPQDPFAARYNKSAGQLWQRNWDADGNAEARAVAISSVDEVWVAGLFEGNIDFGQGTHTSKGGEDAFVAVLDGKTGATIWSAAYGGAGDDLIRGMAPTTLGRVLLAGAITGPVDFGAGALPHTDARDAFLVEMRGEADVIKQLSFPGDLDQVAAAVAYGPQQTVAIAGDMQGHMTVGDTPLSAGGGTDLFVTRIKW